MKTTFLRRLVSTGLTLAICISAVFCCFITASAADNLYSFSGGSVNDELTAATIDVTFTSPAEFDGGIYGGVFKLNEINADESYLIFDSVQAVTANVEAEAYSEASNSQLANIVFEAPSGANEIILRFKFKLSVAPVGNKDYTVALSDVEFSNRNGKVLGGITGNNGVISYVCRHTRYIDGETLQEGDCTTDTIVKTFCAECGVRGDDKIIPASGHTAADAVKENETAPTCTADGSYESVVYCTVCREEISRNVVVVDATGHTLTEHPSKAATCTQAGHNAYVECSVCDYTTFEEIAALGHTAADAVKENETAPTCTTDGSYDSVVYCTVCREEISRETAIVDATGHTLTEYAAKAATCTQAGHNAYVECSVCDYTTFEEIAALGHTAADAVKENETAPTCTTDGSYESVVKCSVCNEELSRDTVIIPATGHDKVQVAAKEPTTTEIGWNAYEYCNNCDYTTYQERPKLPIDKGEWKKNAKGWWYEYTDGSYTKNDWKKIDGVWYHFDASGYMQTGWQKIKNVWYYFKSSGAMVTDWQKISNVWYYFDQNGAMQTGWEKIANVWYYFDASGAMQTGWEKIGGVWYYFKSSGAMQTGWQQIGGTWYYFKSSGAMQTGWQQIGGTWYYFKSSGAMVTGTQVIGGKTYKFNSSGAWIG